MLQDNTFFFIQQIQWGNPEHFAKVIWLSSTGYTQDMRYAGNANSYFMLGAVHLSHHSFAINTVYNNI